MSRNAKILMIGALLAIIALAILAGCDKAPIYHPESHTDRLKSYEKDLIIPHVESLGLPEVNFSHGSRIAIDSTALADKLSDYYLKASYIQGQSSSYYIGDESDTENPFKDANISGAGFPDLDASAHVWIDGIKHVTFNASFINFDLFIVIPIGQTADGSPAYNQHNNYVFEKIEGGLEGFVISENPDSYDLVQLSSGLNELGNLTIYYCTDNSCTDLADSDLISEYTVEILHGSELRYSEVDVLGDDCFGRFRIFAGVDETDDCGGYTPECGVNRFRLVTTSPDAEGYEHCAEPKVHASAGFPNTFCGSCD